MLLSKGKVFIAWGGNRGLAEAVKRKLNERGWDAEIGGVDPEVPSSAFHLPSSILSQLRAASRAILLIQGMPGDGDEVSFRPNLMFEWGFLAARLEPKDIHEFVLGLGPTQLPSDLIGRYVESLGPEPGKDRPGEIGKMADKIATTFLEKVRRTPVDTLEVFKNAQQWWYWVQGVVSQKEAADNLRLAEVLLHSIQPAYYLGQLRELSKLVASIPDPCFSAELADSKSIVSYACKFYGLVCGARTSDKTAMSDVKTGLSCGLKSTEESGTIFTWLRAIQKNFLGLAHLELARCAGSRRREYLKNATLVLEDALHRFLSMKRREGYGFSLSLWLGYVYRNLGLAYRELESEGLLGDPPADLGLEECGVSEGGTSCQCLFAAMRMREEAFRQFEYLKIPAEISNQIHVEQLLVRLDLLRHNGEWDTTLRGEYTEVIEEIKERRPRVKLVGVWRPAFEQALFMARDQRLEEISVDLAKILTVEMV